MSKDPTTSLSRMALTTALKGLVAASGRRAARFVVPASSSANFPTPSTVVASAGSRSPSPSLISQSCHPRNNPTNNTTNPEKSNLIHPDPLPSLYPHQLQQDHLHPQDHHSPSPSPFLRPLPLLKATSYLAFSALTYFSCFPHLLLAHSLHIMPMASAQYTFSSSSNSDISTPRSTSPHSTQSVRSSQSSISTKRASLSSTRRTSNLNPMASVDMQALEEAMKAQQLDQLRGYKQNTYGEVHQERATEYMPESEASGYQVLREPMWNKGELKIMPIYTTPDRPCLSPRHHQKYCTAEPSF